MNSFSKSLTIVFSFCAVILLNACSNTDDAKSSSQTKQSVVQKKSSSKDLKHVHPSNPCSAALNHSHVYQDKEHQHSYDCENTNQFVKNAHIHPATSVSKRTRHVHPNGANKHSHIK